MVFFGMFFYIFRYPSKTDAATFTVTAEGGVFLGAACWGELGFSVFVIRFYSPGSEVFFF